MSDRYADLGSSCRVPGCGQQRAPDSPHCADHTAGTKGVADYGSAMICPHCQQRGGVETERVKAKRGISGGKATGAILTGGISLFATGLSRKEWITKAHCGNCSAGWTY